MQDNDLMLENFPERYWEQYSMFQFVGIEDGGISVWLAFDNKLRDYIVIKRIPRGPSVDKHVERELVNRNTLMHPHIVQLSHIDTTNTTLDVFLEYVHGRNVENYLREYGSLTEQFARRLFQQLCFAVDFCHKRRICVRNITLDNLVLNEEFDVLKINNFNLCKDLQESVARSKVGPCDYMSPEMLSMEPYDGYAADMWACGVCLYAMLYGYKPFTDANDTDDNRFDNTCDRILNQPVAIHDARIDRHFQEVEISDPVKELLTGLLNHDPKQRMTMHEVLTYPWFLECLPEGSFQMNAGVAPIDDKLLCAAYNKPEKSHIKGLLYSAAQPPAASSSVDDYAMYNL